MLDPASSSSFALGLRTGIRRRAQMFTPPSPRRWRRLAWRGAQGGILLLFGLSLFTLFLHNRMTPTRAAERPARIVGQGAALHRINGFALWVLDAGPPSDPLPVIVLHGGPGQSSAPLREAFRFLESDHRVIYYDQRGAGRSEVKPELSHYTIDQLVHDLEILRQAVVKQPRVRLLAHGFGGVLAQHYALSYPEHVESMILLSSLPAEGAQYSSVLEYYDDLLITLVRAGIPPADPVAADEWYARYWYRSAVAMLGDPSRSHKLPDLHGSFGAAQALNTSLAAAVRPQRMNHARLSSRTLLIYGQEESPCGEGEGIAPLLLRFNDATLATLPQTGYWSFLEEPGQVQSLITAFFRYPSP